MTSMLPADNLEQRSTMKKQINIRGQFAYKTDIGRVRIINEDQAIILSNASGDVLMCVCDGMGGHAKGDYASKLAVDVLSEQFRKKSHFVTRFGARRFISKCIRQINTTIYNEAQQNIEYKDMGTTLVVALLYKDDIVVANVGDSRAYSVRYDHLKQLSEDQTYVEYLYRTGKISKEEIATSKDRHVLMNALGLYPSASYEIKVYPNIKTPILLCSDGLYNNATEAEIHAALSTNERIELKIDTLISIANANGGSDNIAIAYWESIEND